MSEQAQIDTVNFLTALAGPDGQHLETHISHLFLGKDQAFKLKKELVFPYLDYGTLEKRHKACLDELTINRAFAPDIYQAAAAITKDSDGGFSLDGDGLPVDWVVVMHRFDDQARLDRALDAGAITRQHIFRFADDLKGWHDDAPKRLDRGGAKGTNFVITSNQDWLAGLDEDAIDHPGMAKLLDDLKILWTGHRDLLEDRRKRGLVRRCHGDMHLENIILMDDRLTPFDAIEFNDWIGSVDLLYDLAFPMMDFCHRGHPVFASCLWNRYLDHTGLDDGFGLMPFFMALRASVRALVAGTAGDRSKADAYQQTASQILEQQKPRLIAIGGLSGSGKSRMGREVAARVGTGPGARWVRTDVVRKRLWGQGLDIALPPDGYLPDMTESTYQAFYEECRQALAMGQAVVADAVFARPDERQQIEALAQRAGVGFCGLWLDAPLDVRKDRVAARKNDVSDATLEVLDHQMTYDLGSLDWHQVDTAAPKAESLKRALGILAEKR